MKRASVSTAKNNLSALLQAVRAGQSVLITDRGVPVARLEPVGPSTRGGRALEALVKSGVVGPARKTLSLDALRRLDRPALPAGVSSAAAVVAEREEGY
ncbi:MAG: type II toxin-antitoxin system prevent-host-death family antitoxin [Gemmatimonadales bacterium]|nr:type II toxin-antitoxin system prevent-host-death family antitoxin [Gemmatimonadales bacterium]